MPLRLENTLTGELNEFEPAEPVDMYYCGLTVSDSPHLGHARGWIHTDVLRRWLEYKGYSVRHIENITDVNEKIFKRLSDEDIDAETESEVAEKYTKEVFESMRDLNLKRAHAYPRVSNHIKEVIGMIESLIDRGYAYESNDSVYFDVTEFENYGHLSNQDIGEFESQENPSELEEKENPQDFALWKAVTPSKTRGQTWSSPWGEGRPGWHIECSVMSSTHLDTPLDIHIGGQDLVFPHHENEIAQSEAHSGEKFANHWLHIRLLNSGKDGEKMSSSRHNFRTVTEAVEQYGANSVRWFLLSSKYDGEQLYTEDKMETAQKEWKSILSTYNRLNKTFEKASSNATIVNEKIRGLISESTSEIRESLDNDLNTREALSSLRNLSNELEHYLRVYNTYDQKAIRMALEFFEEYAVDILGFQFETGRGDSKPIQKLAEFRESLRDDERYEDADLIREALNSVGYDIQDTEDGPILIES